MPFNYDPLPPYWEQWASPSSGFIQTNPEFELQRKQGAPDSEKSGETGNFVEKNPCWEKSGNF